MKTLEFKPHPESSPTKLIFRIPILKNTNFNKIIWHFHGYYVKYTYVFTLFAEWNNKPNFMASKSCDHQTVNLPILDCLMMLDTIRGPVSQKNSNSEISKNVDVSYYVPFEWTIPYGPVLGSYTYVAQIELESQPDANFHNHTLTVFYDEQI